jgi:hypothetical protein
MGLYGFVYQIRVVTRTITDGRTDDRMMAAGSSVTYEVTWE